MLLRQLKHVFLLILFAGTMSFAMEQRAHLTGRNDRITGLRNIQSIEAIKKEILENSRLIGESGITITPLMTTILLPVFSTYAYLFLDENINVRGEDGNTALIFAVKANRADIVDLLLNHGAHVHLKNNAGETALDSARSTCNEDIIALLSGNQNGHQYCHNALHVMADLEQFQSDSEPESDSDRYFTVKEFNLAESAYGQVLEHGNETVITSKKRKLSHEPEQSHQVTNTDLTADQLQDCERLAGTIADFKHAREKSYKCPHCYYTATKKSSITKHVRNNHVKKNKYSCNCCSYSAERTCALTKHMNFCKQFNANQNVQKNQMNGEKEIAQSSNGANEKNNDLLILNAVVLGNSDLVRKYLAQGIDVNAQNSKGQNALIKAVSACKPEIVELLLAHMADPNAQTTLGNTALIIAAAKGEVEIAQKLLEHGADINAKDNRGWTALTHAVVWGGRADSIRVLIENKADVEARDNLGFTALIRAASAGVSQDIMKVLLENGADVDAQNYDGQTALFEAARHGTAALVQLLLDNVAEPEIQTVHGNTALIMAAVNGHEAVVGLLLGHGVGTHPENNSGLNALAYAVLKGHYNIARMLNKGKKKFKCSVCGTTQNRPDQLKFHIQRIHKITRVDE